MSDTFELRVGDLQTPGFGGPRVGFLGVIADSRCPRDVTCIWAGEARVRLALLRSDRDSVLVAATIGGAMPRLGSFPNPVDTLGYRVSLLRLDPYPVSTSTIRPSEYRLRLAITKL